MNLPSASVLSVLREADSGRRRTRKVKSVVFADPVFAANDARVSRSSKAKITSSVAEPFNRLDGSREEAQVISLALGDTSVTELKDFAASRSAVLDPGLANYQIIHFATHGLVNTVRPELSGLVLSLVGTNGTPQLGFVNLQDIYALRLRADLVVLSACETALGENIRGEGPVGLMRGFMYAGSARVLATLWRVNDDATAAFMRLFYGELRNSGYSPAAALRKAQIQMSNQPRFSAPYYWAGFVLEGDAKPFGKIEQKSQ